jgi:hypothetical protein
MGSTVRSGCGYTPARQSAQILSLLAARCADDAALDLLRVDRGVRGLVVHRVDDVAPFPVPVRATQPRSSSWSTDPGSSIVVELEAFVVRVQIREAEHERRPQAPLRALGRRSPRREPVRLRAPVAPLEVEVALAEEVMELVGAEAHVADPDRRAHAGGLEDDRLEEPEVAVDVAPVREVELARRLPPCTTSGGRSRTSRSGTGSR